MATLRVKKQTCGCPFGPVASLLKPEMMGSLLEGATQCVTSHVGQLIVLAAGQTPFSPHCTRNWNR